MQAVGEAVVEHGRAIAAEDPDQRLWAAAATGDFQAFDELRALHWDRVVSVASRLLRDPDDVSDVVQETFLKAYQNLNCRRPANVRAWLLRVTINGCRERQRRSWRWSRVLERIGGSLPSAPDPQGLAEGQITRAEIEAAIAELPEDLSTPLILRAFEGLSGAEIAAVLNRNESTVWTRIYAARRRLRKELVPFLDLDDKGSDRVKEEKR